MTGKYKETLIPVRGKSMVHKTAAMMARAFQEDPFYSALFPDPQRRLMESPTLFQHLIRMGIRYGEVLTLSNDCMDAAVWIRPEGMPESPLRADLAGRIRFMLESGFRTVRRFDRLSGPLYEAQKELAPKPHWYLFLLAVDPDTQGESRATRLLSPKLKFFDSSKQSCYLETCRSDTAAMYRRFGFSSLDTRETGEPPLKTWMMIRNP